MPYEFNTLAVTLDAGILDIALNRPDKRNAISPEMQRELDVALDTAEVDPDVKAVTLRGSGAVFTAGHDLRAVSTPENPAERRFPVAVPSTGPRFPRAWYFRKPLIAGVHSYVGGYGIALVACCDFTIAATGTRFSGEMFRSRPAAPEAPYLPLYAQLPMRVIEKIWLLGGWMDAEQALQFQFVQRIVAAGEVEDETRRWAEQAALMPTESFGANKDQIRRSFELMGLASLPVALARFGPPPSEDNSEFGENVKTLGLKEALRIRDAKFDAGIARV